VAEAKGQRAADRIEYLKKSDMAAEAETLLSETGWLPEPLRTPAVAETAAKDGITAMGETAGIADSEDAAGKPHAIAAE